MDNLRTSSLRFLLLLLFIFSSSRPSHVMVRGEETCSLQPIQMQIRYRNCAPRNILLYGCSGHCSSYTQPDINSPTQLERSCRCCRELGRRKVAVVLRCPRQSRSRGRQHRRVALRLRVPVRCACRPCSGHSMSSP
ncbi:bursicon-like [Babylonia areolata]|uniref:bursicon-like n=1 Tax=Babylonia areolata TaxID=304850 RepID=UPI003FD0D779